MAISIRFDLSCNPELPTIILANRRGKKLGQLNVDYDSVDLKDKLVEASEFSFTLNKYVDGKLNNLWNEVVDFKLVYCKEWDMWFEINVELDEATETVKTVFCTQLGHAELSQLNLYNIEINTEEDIARDDYKITILYHNEPDKSCLNRLLKDKAPHYSIIHVDKTIANIQRSFSFDDISIDDAFQKIAEEIGCLFVYPSNSDESGKIQRTIAVYDLQQNCNDCGHRGEFTDICPKCGSKNIKYGYGKDTTIFVTSDELASSGIQLATDSDSVKNCFKLEAGDDLMTATIRNCNPNGTDYIWRFSDETKADMSIELVKKLDSYDKLYEQYYNDGISNLDSDLVNKYNNLVDKYIVYDENLTKITNPMKGYVPLMTAYYNVIDLALFLESGLMPSIKISETNATKQAALLTNASLSPVAVTNIGIASLSTVNSTILSMARIVVDSAYKVEINGTPTLSGSGSTRTWKGNFVVTNYGDEEDTAISSTISVTVNDDYKKYVEQKIEKALNKKDTEDYSISGLFEKDYDSFCKELKKYALNPLTSFRDACVACIDILIEQGVGDSEHYLYESLYTSYYNKLQAIETEVKLREDELNIIKDVYDINDKLVSEGLQTNIEKCKNTIQNILDFERYLGNDLLLEFCAYRREDKYSNSNYISDGLNNTELFEKALEFIEVANNEIYKASERQHSISTTLNNLLAIPKFKPLVESFDVGNWIRVQIDDEIYKLRLLEYEIDYGDFDHISVEFSDVTKIKNGIADVENMLSQASSMASSYEYVKKQASQGNKTSESISAMLKEGLQASNTSIVNAKDQCIKIDENGILLRMYDDVIGDYLPEQGKIVHNSFNYTKDNWKTSSCALGKHVVDNIEYYGLMADLVVAGLIYGTDIKASNITSTTINNGNGTFYVDENGNMVANSGTFKGNISASNIDGGTITGATISGGTITGLGIYGGSINIGNGTFTVDKNGNMNASSGTFKGSITGSVISGGELNGTKITGGSIKIGKTYDLDGSKRYMLGADDEEMNIGDFNVEYYNGRYIFQTYDEFTGLSPHISGSSNAGKLAFWVAYNSDDDFGLIVRQNGSVVAKGLRVLGDLTVDGTITGNGSGGGINENEEYRFKDLVLQDLVDEDGYGESWGSVAYNIIELWEEIPVIKERLDDLEDKVF